MARYSTLDLRQATSIGHRFGLEVHRVQRLGGGMRNSSFLVEAAEGRFVFGVMDSQDLAGARELCDLMAALAAAGLPTPGALRADDGGHVVTDSAGTPVMARPHLDGHVPAAMPARHLDAAGALLAHIHTAAPPPNLGHAARRLPPDWRDRLSRCDNRAFLDRLARIDHPDNLTRWRNLPRSLTHGDLFADNLIHVNGRWHVIDWEYASVDACAIDLGIAAIGLCRTGIHIDQRRLKLLLQGYERYRRLQPDEHAALTTAISHGALVLAYERWTLHNLDRPDLAQADTYRELDQLAASLCANSPV